MRYIIANWKMNGKRGDVAAYAQALRTAVLPDDVQLIICPPFTLLADFADRLQGSKIALGAQNGHAAEKGAYTGEVSMPQLKDIGCDYVLVGHSERRAVGESDEDVQAKALAAQAAGLTPVICVGEDLAARETGQAASFVVAQVKASIPVLSHNPHPEEPRSGVSKDAKPGESGRASFETPGYRQAPQDEVSDKSLKKFLIAYEPVWAIGSGRIPSGMEIETMHAAIRQALQTDTPILYGGSVKPDNAAQLSALAGVDGLLVGGASLDAANFLTISQYE